MKRLFYCFFSMFIILSACLRSQIIYNKFTPISKGKNDLTAITKLPRITFVADKNSNLILTDLNSVIKKDFLIEKLNGLNIARLSIKVIAEKLGEISLIFKNVELKNNAYCTFYTPDYKIIAGPIYEKSINKKISLMSIPSDEIIVEIVYNEKKDYGIILDKLSYYSVSKKNQSKDTELTLQSQNDSCFSCSQGRIEHANNNMDCTWFGARDSNELFLAQKFKPINFYNYDVSRSSCVIMDPNCNNAANYGGENGTLINFPYIDCENQNDCGFGFVFSVWHTWAIQNIIQAQLSNNLDFLDNVLIRFNWHHRYGQIDYLKDIDCFSNADNFTTWRNSIDFSEVIDYCGVRVFGYKDYDSTRNTGDIVILKMMQKPFFKELHLGFSEQANYNYKEGVISNIIDYNVIGRRAKSPTILIKNYDVDFRGFDYLPNVKYTGNIRSKVIFTITDGDQMIGFNSGLIGYSGSQLTYKNHLDTNQRIGLGLITKESFNLQRTSYWIQSKNYYTYFNRDSIIILDECYSNYIKINDYFNGVFNNSLPWQDFTYHHKEWQHNIDTNFTSSFRYSPSLENKQKCPSQKFVQDSCKFNISNFIHWNDFTKCISLDSIPTNLFPGNVLPKGLRIYYNYGDQKTLYFDPFVDNLPVDFNFSHCFSSCELFELNFLGKNSLDLAFDFYDADGRILNNIGCEKIEFKADFTFDLCSMIDINVVKTEPSANCCNYIFNVTIKDSCAKNKPFIKKIAQTLKLLKSPSDDGTSLSNIPGVVYNYSTGTINFSRQICDSNSNEKFIFSYQDGQVVCNSPVINPESCICSCPEDEIINNWVTVTTSNGGVGESCPEGFCNINFNIDIPPYYNCYKFFKMGTSSRLLSNGKGSISFCIPAGTARTDEIYLQKSLGDTTPCKIIKHTYCPILSEPKFCKSGCVSVEWDDRKLEKIMIPDCPNCFINAKYKTRTNTCEIPNKQELQVTEIEVFNSTGDSLACAPCVGNMAEIHKLVILKAIHKNEMGFKPILVGNETSKCDETWRVSISSCWAEYTSSIELQNGDLNYQPKKKYVPCDTICCSVGLRVCRYVGPPEYITIDAIQNGSNPNLCLTDSLFIYDPIGSGFGGSNPQIDPSGASSSTSYQVWGFKIPCINRCDWLNILSSGAYYGKRALPYVANNSILIRNECKLLTYLDDNYMNCIFDSDLNSNNFFISIFSINGELLQKERVRVFKGENEFTININTLQAGIYLIQAELNGICSKTEKLIIIK